MHGRYLALHIPDNYMVPQHTRMLPSQHSKSRVHTNKAPYVDYKMNRVVPREIGPQSRFCLYAHISNMA